MDISIEYMDKVLKNKASLDQKNLSNFSKSEKYKIWQLMLDAIPGKHLSKKAREKIELCAILSKRLKNK